ncbi:class I SAM-dependent methyltransferase [Chroococcidiopsis thermalis]|uniref:Methyltransferase type 11 n=1 Tax=Chroococcidiopsis thermalis (strain PCC 7203) TaxID=251229 RepID=K9U0M0_CHRTP|nr:methyltransferase domain-containing protein [Chroococcidiopsis thermalis]AFY88375.1 Methyltransferase type 11 [Chroococcidiopsis thermalis PCC 7203]PSB41172.1 methyltransferase domain-containing protein [Cyanosarcina cf. burmensis CCALA 770]
MTTRMNEYKQQIITDFNSRTNYDNEFRHRFAKPLIELAQLKPGQRVLDVATGTGIVAIAAAKIVGDAGYVLGVDISTGMLAQARHKVELEKLQNIELIEADADDLHFDDNSFDVIFCSAAIAYLTHVFSSLRQWYRFLNTSGIVAFSCFAETAHTASILFREKAQQFGITINNPNELLGTPEKCQALLQQTGFQNIEVVTQQFGFYFKDAETAWNAHANNVYGYQVYQLSPDKLAQLKAEYMAEIHALSTEQGFGHDVNSLFVFARKS